MARFSVLIPTYNRLEYLRDAVESVLLCKSNDLELVVVDDASSDNTLEYLQTRSTQDSRLRYFRNSTNLGMVGNWNQCLSLSKGTWIKLLGDDDQIFPGAMDREILQINERNDIALYAGRILEIKHEDFQSRNREKLAVAKGISGARTWDKESVLKQMIIRENCIGTPSAVWFKKSALSKFDSNFLYATDWAAWLEILDAGKVYSSDLPSCFFRLHPKNLTKKFVEDGTEIAEVLKLRWVALRKLEHTRPYLEFRIYLGIIVFYRLLRRAFKMLMAGKINRFPHILRKVAKSLTTRN